MKKKLFFVAVLVVSTCLSAQVNNNPFAKYGYKKQIMYTSSKGEFEEFHDQADIVEIGSALFNTKTNQVVGFVSEEKENADVASATTAMSIDPLCEKYYWISPYVYCLDNPVNLIDKDGRQVLIPTLWGVSTPLLGATDLVKVGAETGATRTAIEVATKTSETTGGKTINLERINAGRQVEGEQLQKLGMEKNIESFTRVDPKTGNEGTTTPDGIKNGQTTEIKNLKEGSTQNLTKQLRLQKEVSNGNEQMPKLHINENVKLSKPLQDAGFEVTRYSAPPVAVAQDNTKIKVIEPIKVLDK